MRASHAALLRRITRVMERPSSAVALISGSNTITKTDTTKTQILVFVPPPGRTEILTLMGFGTDTGVRLSPSIPSIIAVDDGDNAVIINSNGAFTANIEWVNEQ